MNLFLQGGILGFQGFNFLREFLDCFDHSGDHIMFRYGQ